jgi:hypothetical protein
VSIVDDVGDAVRPSRVTEAIVVALGAVVAVAICWIDWSYRRWAAQNSPFASSRARAAAIKASYRRKRSGFEEFAQLLGDLLGVFDQAT